MVTNEYKIVMNVSSQVSCLRGLMVDFKPLALHRCRFEAHLGIYPSGMRTVGGVYTSAGRPVPELLLGEAPWVFVGQ